MTREEQHVRRPRTLDGRRHSFPGFWAAWTTTGVKAGVRWRAPPSKSQKVWGPRCLFFVRSPSVPRGAPVRLSWLSLWRFGGPGSLSGGPRVRARLKKITVQSARGTPYHRGARARSARRAAPQGRGARPQVQVPAPSLLEVVAPHASDQAEHIKTSKLLLRLGLVAHLS